MFYPGDCRLLMERGTSIVFLSLKTLILIRFLDTDSPKESLDQNQDSVTLDSQHWFSYKKIWFYPVSYFSMSEYGTTLPVFSVCLWFRTCTCCKISRGLNIRYNKPNVHRRLRWRAHSLYYYYIQVLKEMVEKIGRFKFNRNQCCGSGMFITDPYFFHPLCRIRIKEFNYFNPKKWFLSSRKYDSVCSSRIRVLTFYPSWIPDPVSRGHKGTGSRILDLDPQHW